MLSRKSGLRAAARLLLVVFTVAIVQDGVSLPAAFAQARSSGGYSRPSAGGSSSYSSRRPSTYGGGSGSFGGGGYGRPSTPSYGYSGGSAGDRAVSRQGSSQALQDYQNAQRRPSPSYGWGSGAVQPPPQVDRRPSPSYGWGGWGAPPASSGSGVVNTLLLWTLLNSLSRPGNADYFRNNQNDPTYRQWRQEAEARASTDPAVADKLRELDAQLAAPRQAPSPSAGSGDGLLWLVLFVGGGVLVLLWVARRRAAARGGGGGDSVASPAAAGLRVGMTFTLDPTPFVLAGGVTKVQPPAGGTTSAEAVSSLRDGRTVLYRLYLPGRQTFMQIHAAPGGAVDECRYFSHIDEVTPADGQEWGFWLDPIQGMIGWPEFQTKDGKTYGRAWLPGSSRVAPRAMEEALQALGGVTRRRLQMMLYAAPTEAAPPAPATEYILVAAVQEAGQAWVEIHAGIDINPAALSLPSVPLEPDRRSA
jgi:hypothetical protein